MQNTQVEFVYWEKQGSDRLCGVHCINSLLQGPFFDEIQLSNIALELDQEEKALMMEQGDHNKHYQDYLKEGSNNVADDGNYSIQVLTEALKQIGGLVTESVDKAINKNQDLSAEAAFICNSQSHWFAIRRAGNTFYNLNSTNEIGPQVVSDFYLSAFLLSIKENGYTIFVVKGQFPVVDKALFPYLQKHQRFYTLQEVQKIHEIDLKKKNHKLNLGGTDERDLDKAIEESKRLYERGNNIQDQNIDAMEEEENKQQEKPKFNPFQGQGVTFEDNQKIIVNYEKFSVIMDSNDPELSFILNLTLKEELQKKFIQRPQEGFVICFRHPNGQKSEWTFSQDARVEELYDFAKFNMPENESYEFYLTQNYPKKNFLDVYQTLIQESIEDMTNIIVVKN